MGKGHTLNFDICTVLKIFEYRVPASCQFQVSIRALVTRKPNFQARVFSGSVFFGEYLDIRSHHTTMSTIYILLLI